ncbi:MAG TPA: hypothetical protein VFN30_06705 [Chitinophagaceae bacterium]|nr:hypothetical protein [Chitinophagaceae bacterium]
MKTIILSILFFSIVNSAKAQKNSIDSMIIGIWKGTSTCQIKNSPCHDETVVYYISKIQGIDTFNISANKIVNGKEEEMGIIGCKLDKMNNRLLSASPNTLWTFNFKNKNLNGTLYFKGNLYRIIKLVKQK